MNSVILLTGTIDPSCFNSEEKMINVFLTNAQERLKQYTTTIIKLICTSVFTDIVFVENSGYRFDIDEIVELAKKYGKNFEFLQQPLNISQIDMIKEKGKSYGEASLIDFAFKNSILIKKYEEVYKITGRIFLKNSETILRKQKKGNSEFICKNKIGWMNTEFFKMTKSDYFNVFSNALELVDDYEKKCIEKVYYKLSVNAKLKVTCFRSYPLLTGRVASEKNRRYDKNGIKLLACRVFTYLHIYDLKY